MPGLRATDAGPAPIGVDARSALRRWIDALPLATQLLVGGVLVAAVVAGLAAWLAPAAVATTAAALAGASALAAALANAAWSRRTQVALDNLAEAARSMARTEAPDDAQLPSDRSSAEMALASTRLRRYVDHVHQERQALRLRNAELGAALSARAHELATLQDLSISLSSTADQFRLMDEALRALERTLDFSSASVWSRDRRGDSRQVVLMAYRSTDIDPEDVAAQRMRGKRLSRANLARFEQIERAREPVVDNDARQSLLSWLWNLVSDDAGTSRLYSATRAWTALPLKFRDDVLGVLRVDHQAPGFFTDERIRLLNAVCSQAALAMRHAQLLARERDVAVVAERNRIARDLHDAVSQTLFAANLLAGSLRQSVQRIEGEAGAALAEQVTTLERLNQSALAEMRLLMFELRPDALEQVPLAELLRQGVAAMAGRGEVAVELQLAEHDPLSPATRVQVWRIAQEALSNLARHSAATQAVVEWKVDGQRAELRIADDGRGFDPAQPVPGHFGLENMRTRAAEIGAELTLHSQPGEGTEVKLILEPAKP
jgi:signal transduction histidine kinase